jgi:hypothetical protein
MAVGVRQRTAGHLLAGASERFRRHEATYREALLDVRDGFSGPRGPDRTAEQPASS